MNDTFCPKCGKQTDVLYDSVCRECFIERKKLFECPAVIHTKICPTCGSHFTKGRWVFNPKESDSVLNSVKGALNVDDTVRNQVVTFSPHKLDASRYRVDVESKAEVKGVEIKETCVTEVRISWETCDTCSRRAGGYFEGIVQIRADKRFPTHEELEKCKNIAIGVADRSLEKGDRLAFITKVVERDEGIDLFVGLTKLGEQICKAIIDVFGGRVTESPKLVGQKDGVELYRITYALRLPEFVRGDIISADDKVIHVQNCGKFISGIDLETGKRFMEKYDSIMEIKKLARRDDSVSSVLVADEGKTIQVLDPDTYETVTLKKPGFPISEPGNEIRVIKTAKGLFVLP